MRDVHSSPSIIGEIAKIRKIIVTTVCVTFLINSFSRIILASKKQTAHLLWTCAALASFPLPPGQAGTARQGTIQVVSQGIRMAHSPRYEDTL